MTKFNFSEQDFEKGSASKAFNGGKPGRVKNVKVRMDEAGKDGVPANTNERAPKFRVVFEDENGAFINRACFDIKPENYPDSYGNTYAEAMKKEMVYLNNIVKHSGGELVLDFDDDTDLFRKVKTALGTKKINIFTNFGTQRSPKENLEVRKFLPMSEPADTVDSETKLIPSKIDNMKLVIPDVEEEDTDDAPF